MTPLETYLREVHATHSCGAAVDETSYYPALSNLLNEVGKSLKPRVRAVINLANRGAGIPDGGLFTAEQFASSGDPLPGQPPARGAIEAKGTRADAGRVAESEQVLRYLEKYGQVLVTNLRDFILLGRDAEGKPTKLESYRLAESESAFWAAAASAVATDHKQGARFIDYLRRVMLHAAPLAAPEDLAWFLASYARDARARIEGVRLPALANVRKALEEALGLRFEGDRGEHFFRSSLVQTLFYGIFSAWVLWSKQHPPASKARFDWNTTARYLRVPMIGKLFYLVADPNQLDALKLSEVLDWTAAALNRVDRASFFAKFQETHAVQYFYEPFLEAFDPELRKELGVWYTPPEIVKYMVARVDTVLREELNVADGLADKNVYVLDPCCGTGSYLVEVLQRIYQTLKERGENGLSAGDLKEAAQNRVFGFEILPAPFVVSHLQLGLLLQNLGVPLSDKKNERVGVYLTNALTGWEPPKEPKTRLLFPELESERDAAERVKQDVPILVILGNPPYNGFAGVAVEEERDLSNAYRTTKRAPPPQGQGLNDLYVRFFRMAERRIVEKTGKGVICLISNYSWLDGLSFTGMRERYLEAFDRIWIDNLHGDRIISEYAPDGRTSETVFAMEGTSPGIKIGTAITLLAAKLQSGANNDHLILYRDMDQARANDRRGALLRSLQESDFRGSYKRLVPVVEIGLPFKPRAIGEAYLTWPLLPELLPTSFPGVKTSRDDALVAIDRERLVDRMQKYFDPAISHEEMRRIAPGAMTNTARFNAEGTRAFLTGRGFLPQNIVRYCYRPFDVRWLYWEPATKLLDEKRADYFPHVFEGNAWMVAQQKPRRAWSTPQFIRSIGCLDLMDRGASCIPLKLAAPKQSDALLPKLDPGHSSLTGSLNLSGAAAGYVTSTGALGFGALFYHALAVLQAPAYRTENAGALRQDWPRVPLPATAPVLLASSELGESIARLLDSETAVKGVTTGQLRSELRPIAVPTPTAGRALSEEDLALTAGWGHAGKGGVTMPAKGKWIERDYTPDEQAAIAEGAATLGLPLEQATAQLGDRTCDVYLNDAAYWRNVPIRVWEYTIGGYQVIKKWLSYRECRLLGRALTKDEVREVQNIARRIAAILLLQPALDANYSRIRNHTYPWQKPGGP